FKWASKVSCESILTPRLLSVNSISFLNSKVFFPTESCRGRCGAEYYRGHMCQCDYSCLSYGECCSDYESQCTSKHSCKGRCGENFKRGRRCTCDSDCFKFGQCCPDYKAHCEIFPLDDPSTNGDGDPEASPGPEIISGDGSNPNSDSDLCSGRPVGGVTTLRNGTIVVFRGHYFWFLDRNRVPSPPRGITEVWGVPSPIDTVFTRCNCQGKTYIFKVSKYWRFENDALDSGYPKAIKVGFDGLQGHITAALSVPQYLNRKESVFFFKRGGTVQKYSYQFGTSSGCRRTSSLPVYTVRSRFARQAGLAQIKATNDSKFHFFQWIKYLVMNRIPFSLAGLNPVNIRKAWRGFPSTITAAVSLPSSRDPEGYRYVVFSRCKSDTLMYFVDTRKRPATSSTQAQMATTHKVNKVKYWLTVSRRVLQFSILATSGSIVRKCLFKYRFVFVVFQKC
uniref:SMB domain-containing protein n=1 Tax=Cyprinodon variegatus TaxID=28743 RepID=A0A3Q2FZL2_CYPVA